MHSEGRNKRIKKNESRPLLYDGSPFRYYYIHSVQIGLYIAATSLIAGNVQKSRLFGAFLARDGRVIEDQETWVAGFTVRQEILS